MLLALRSLWEKPAPITTADGLFERRVSPPTGPDMTARTTVPVTINTSKRPSLPIIVRRIE